MLLIANICTNSTTYYLQHTMDWTELNVLLYDGTHVLTGLLLCAWLRLTTFSKLIWRGWCHRRRHCKMPQMHPEKDCSEEFAP